MTQEFDSKFHDLKWLPWIGSSYCKIKNENRLLLVGESHYFHPNAKNQGENNYTRRVIEDTINEEYYNPTFPNLLKAIHGFKKVNSEKFWESICYYNFIQRLMVNSTDRPTTDDYIKGWDTFSVVISILKPSICLFNGVTSFNYIFRSQIFSERLKILDCVKGDKIGNTSPRFCDIVGSDDLSIKCIFIKHSGKYFPYKKWNILLQSKLGDFIDLIYST